MEFENTFSLRSWYYDKLYTERLERGIKQAKFCLGLDSFNRNYEKTRRDLSQIEEDAREVGFLGLGRTRKLLELSSILLRIKVDYDVWAFS